MAQNVQDVQKDLLQQLYELREEFYSQLSSLKSGDGSEEVKILADQNRRLEYRVLHLTTNMDALIQHESQLQAENEQLKAKITQLEKQ